jgi:hypothetical protein
MIEEIRGIMNTEEIVNKRNTKRDMIQDLIKVKMGQNTGRTKAIITIKRTINGDNKGIEDNSVVKKE